MMGWSALRIALLFLITVDLVSGGVVYYYTKADIAVDFPGDLRLDGDILRTYISTHLAVNCLTRCQLIPGCKSVNYNRKDSLCQIVRQSHITPNFDQKLVPSPGWQYYPRGYYKLVKQSEPCDNSPCENDGICKNVRTEDGALDYQCICSFGQTGKHCSDDVGENVFGNWDDWSECSVSCGHGLKYRKRQCFSTVTGEAKPTNGCSGTGVERMACEEVKECPKWSEWTEWAPTNDMKTVCGIGQVIRSRSCLNGGTVFVDRGCMGTTTETKEVLLPSCDAALKLTLDGTAFSGQQAFGKGRLLIFNDQTNSFGTVCADNFDMNAGEIACKQLGFSAVFKVSKLDHIQTPFAIAPKCNVDSHNRLAMCDNTADWTDTCVASLDAIVECVVDGGFTDWTDWGTCTVTCAKGTQIRTRSCENPAPARGGLPCEGSLEDLRDCTPTPPPCPIDGTWSEWSEWGQCNKTCAGGWQGRERVCSEPLHNGLDCEGTGWEITQCNTHSCPVNGYWEPWTQWAVCSQSCNGGSRSRVRECHEPLHGGSTCSGESAESGTCGEAPCPIDGVYEDWSVWGACTVTCGGGIETRTRDCTPPQHDGRDCLQQGLGPASESIECNTQSCAVDGIWQEWSQWGACSLTCGTGLTTRHRKCTPPLNNGAWCPDVAEGKDGEENKPCLERECPVPCVWNDWTEWTVCSKTCGPGVRERTRDEQVLAQYGGAPCDGNASDNESCQDKECPVDGLWSEWSNWGSCSMTCGQGIRNRGRSCEGIKYGGAGCQGAATEDEDCMEKECPVDCLIEEWSLWSACSESCGPGTSSRSRNIIRPMQFDGVACPSDLTEEQACNLKPCPIDGSWGAWEAWGVCDRTCGDGTSLRTRVCDSPPPQYEGLDCSGDSGDSMPCNLISCPIDCVVSAWSEWGSCTEPCGGGSKTRLRDVLTAPLYGGTECDALQETTDCNTHECPIDCEIQEWQQWQSCTVSCGGGSRQRERGIAVQAKYGGLECTEALSESEDCGMDPCPIDGGWTEWGQWGECTATCSGGLQTRQRSCTSPAPKYGGRGCVEVGGTASEQRPCNQEICPEPGTWTSWGDWTKCDQTCDGGHMIKTRTCEHHDHFTLPCNDTVHGNTQTQTCNDFNCLPLPKSCAEAVERGLESTDYIELDLGSSLLRVVCDVTTEETVIHHNFETPHLVEGYEGQGEYTGFLEYYMENDDGSRSPLVMDNVACLVAISAECEQTVSWSCVNAQVNLYEPPDEETRELLEAENKAFEPRGLTYWVSRNRERQWQWGQVSAVEDQLMMLRPGQYSKTYCECYDDGSCGRNVNYDYVCHCDANDDTKRTDQGTIRDKTQLPVMAVCAGDTGSKMHGNYGIDEPEHGNMTVGALKCRGVDEMLQFGLPSECSGFPSGTAFTAKTFSCQSSPLS